jgi:hypothetical protein
MDNTEQRALQVIEAAGGNTRDAEWMLGVLRGAGLILADETNDELVTRWVNVLERPVPPDADTIIRTITKTVEGHASSSTHWLEGLRAPRATR